MEAATVDRWLSALELEPIDRGERGGIASWDLRLDGRRRPDIRVTLILDPATAMLFWVHYAPPLNDSFRVSYRQFLRWNDELPFVKFALAADDRPVLTAEVEVAALDEERLGLTLTRLLAVCDLTYERATVWLHPGAKKPAAMGRPSRQAALFERYEDALVELLGEDAAESRAPDEPSA